MSVYKNMEITHHKYNLFMNKYLFIYKKKLSKQKYKDKKFRLVKNI